jgi:hypothetical protein
LILIFISKSGHKESDEYNHFWRCSIWKKKRNQYTKEYKTEAVGLIVEEGRPISELARELETAQSLLHRWKKKSEEGKVMPFTVWEVQFDKYVRCGWLVAIDPATQFLDVDGFCF